jgi:hypothetical protein
MHREYPQHRATLLLDRVEALGREFRRYQPRYPELLGDDVDVYIANRIGLSAAVVGELRAVGRREARRRLVERYRLPARFSLAEPDAWHDEDVDLTVMLAQNLQLAAAMCEYLEWRIDRDGTLIRTVTQANGTQRQEPTVAMRLLGQWHDRHLRAAVRAIRAGIAESARPVSDEDLRSVVDVFVAAIGELRPDFDLAHIRAAISREARQISADATSTRPSRADVL